MSENPMGTPENPQGQPQVPSQAPEQAMPQAQAMPQQPVPNADVPGVAPVYPPAVQQPKKKKKLVIVIISIVAVLFIAAVLAVLAVLGVFTSAPDKAEVQKGLEQIWNEDMGDLMVEQLSAYGMTEDEATKLVGDAATPFAECVVDKIYDKADARTLNWLAAGEDKQVASDLDLVQGASGDCTMQALERAFE